MSDEENEVLGMTDDSFADTGEFEAAKAPAADILRILEALIFASDEQLTAARLKAILPGNPDAREIGKMIERINRLLQKERHPFEIVEIGGGYQFKTIAYYHPWVRQIFKEKAAKRLSLQALECLSIIAYRQPLSKAEIEAIRGVLSEGAMKTLLEKRLITITGRSEKVGKPLLYGTTPEFLKYFGLNKIADLPKIEEFEALVRQKMESMPIEELQSVQAEAQAALSEEQTRNAEAQAGEEAQVFEMNPAATGEPQRDKKSQDSEPLFEVAIKDEPLATAHAAAAVEGFSGAASEKESRNPVPETEAFMPQVARKRKKRSSREQQGDAETDAALLADYQASGLQGGTTEVEHSKAVLEDRSADAAVFEMGALPHAATDASEMAESLVRSTDGETVLQEVVKEEPEIVPEAAHEEKPPAPGADDDEATFEVKL